MKKIFLCFTVLLTAIVAAGVFFVFPVRERLLSGYHEKMAYFAEEKSDFKNAEAHYLKSIYYNPDMLKPRLGLIGTYLKNDNYEAAESVYLDGIKHISDSTELYTGLSALYVKQGKLLDACMFLNGIKSEYVRTRIGAIRPKPPEFTPASGRYNRRVSAEIITDEKNACYFTVGENTEYKNYTGPIPIDTGSTVITAVSVSPDGLVSDFISSEYILEKIVERVYFKDSAIEAMAREALNKPKGTFLSDELWDIKALTNVRKNGEMIADTVESFEDIKYFTSLEKLELCNLKGGVPIATLPGIAPLYSIKLSNCSLTSEMFRTLFSLELIRELDISNNKISDLYGISGLKHLEVLNISGNNVSDLSGLASLINLYFLDAGENAISDLSPLSALKKLSSLKAADNRISDLSPLMALENLSFLDVSSNKLYGIEPVSKIKSLRALICRKNEITDLTPVAELINLESLDSSQNRIGMIEALKNLKKLKSVDLSENLITDISPISGSSELTTLKLAQNKLRDISAVGSLSKLIMLDVRGNPITDYSPIKDCGQLRSVFWDSGLQSQDGAAIVSGSAYIIQNGG